MFLKKIIFVTLFLFSIHGLGAEEKKTLPVLKETIKFKELTEFDACFLIYRAPISFNLKDMLRDYMKFREFECAKYDEILNLKDKMIPIIVVMPKIIFGIMCKGE